MSTTLPRIISVDDHVVEPPDLFLEALPESLRDRAPRVERRLGYLGFEGEHYKGFVDDPDAPNARWGDYWLYDDLVWPLTAGFAAIGETRKLQSMDPVTYDEIDQACWDQGKRLQVMDANHTDASLCFPTMPRFCGQHFLERPDKQFALTCVRAYNDWTAQSWCAGEGYGRLIPIAIVPLWDAHLAADEIRRCAAMGIHSMSFSECPPHIGLPSIHSGYWDPMFAACQEVDTVVNMHIGTASRLPRTGGDSPPMVTIGLTFQNSQTALVDWLSSGVLDRFPRLKIALSEGQVGWMPFIIDRLDSVWDRHELYETNMRDRVPKPPSEYIAGRVYGCLFDDVIGLRNREAIGMSQLMFEVDFPHADSTYPDTADLAQDLIDRSGLNEAETYALMRGNAIECYGLGRYGVDK